MELQWPLILFTTLAAWSVGVFGTQSLLALKGEGKKSQMTCWIVAAVLLVVSGIAVFLHLQHWERIFNGFGHITSGITQELIAIVVLAVIAVIYLACLRRSDDGGSVPSWCAICGIVIAVVLDCVMAHSYMMDARPAWNSIVEILSIIGASCILGPATVSIIEEMKDGGVSAISASANFIGSIVAAVTSIGYLIVMAMSNSAFTQIDYYFDPVHPTHGMVDLANITPFGSGSVGLTIVTIVCALVPIACAYMGKKKGNWKMWGAIALVAGLACAICLRVVFYQMGASVYALYSL